MKKILKVIIVISITSALQLVHAQSNNLIINPSFENGFAGWDQVEPAEESDKKRSGIKSAKLSGQDAKISQLISVKPKTDYILTAYILGYGRIGVQFDEDNEEDKRIFDSVDWNKAELEFNTGSSTEVTIFGQFNRSEGRYDDFALIEKSAAPTSIDTLLTQCPGTGSVPIVGAYDDGTNDGNPPENAYDDNLSNRWSSKGIGKTITFDIGQIVEAKQLDVLWYKGGERINLFTVQTSTDGSTWQTVLADASSFSTPGFDTYDIENFLNSDAQYVKIIGNGNSANEWNSIIEVKLRGCVQ